MTIPTFDAYLETISRVSAYVDPTAETSETIAIKAAATSLEGLGAIDAASLVTWIGQDPSRVPVLGLVVGLSQEKVKNALKQHLGTTGWIATARQRGADIVAMLDQEFGLIASLTAQLARAYSFGDVLVARAGTRATAVSATASGRTLEDRIEAIAVQLGLPYVTRSRFEGRGGQTAPCDLAVPADGAAAQIVVAAKAFDSTGSKLTDAVREVEDMANARRPNQYVMAVVDGVGWLNRQSDLRKMHALWVANQIDGMYTVATLSQFENDLATAARLRGLIA